MKAYSYKRKMSEEIIKEVMARNPKKILTKQENYALYEAGILGNKVLTWNSYAEILRSGWKGMVCIRSKKGIERGKMVYNIKIEDIPKYLENFGGEENVIFNQSMPDEHLIIQGEIMNDQKGIHLLYTTIKKPMNLGLAEENRTVNGPAAEKILFHNLSEESYNEINRLLIEFPESVIEFSTYSVPVGNLPNRNTVIWEVRNY